MRGVVTITEQTRRKGPSLTRRHPSFSPTSRDGNHRSSNALPRPPLGPVAASGQPSATPPFSRHSIPAHVTLVRKRKILSLGHRDAAPGGNDPALSAAGRCLYQETSSITSINRHAGSFQRQFGTHVRPATGKRGEKAEANSECL